MSDYWKPKGTDSDLYRKITEIDTLGVDFSMNREWLMEVIEVCREHFKENKDKI